MNWHESDRLPARDAWTAIKRGFFGRCPNCGGGGIFGRFLKVNDRCSACGEALHHHRSDDAPAYFVILIAGHTVVPSALAVEVALSPPYLVHALLWGPLTLLLSLGLLQPIKGAIVAWQWAHHMHGFDPRGDADMHRDIGARIQGPRE